MTLPKCNVCNQPCADPTFVHKLCRLKCELESTRSLLESEMSRARVSNERLGRYEFMRDFLFKHYGVDILPEASEDDSDCASSCRVCPHIVVCASATTGWGCDNKEYFRGVQASRD